MADQNSSNAMRLRAKFVTQYVQLEEPPAHSYTIAMIATIVLLLIGSIVWAAFTPVAELAYARGEVVPIGLTHRIQHPQGGRISIVNVKNGDKVEVGDALVSFSSEEVLAQLGQINARYSALTMEATRLAALLDDGPMSLQAAPEYADMVASQEVSYLRELANLADRRATLEHEIAQRKAQLAQYREESSLLLSRVEALQEKMDMLVKLEESQTVAPLELIETRAAMAQVSAEHVRANGAANAAKSALANANARLTQIGSDWKRELSARASEVANLLAETEETRSGLQHRLASAHIAAPINGIVKLTNFASVNAVVGAGEVIMEIVPTNDELMVQALVATTDIGYVDVGQSTWVEFDGYDRNTHGLVRGNVKQISASTYVDPEGTPYYQAEVMLSDADLRGRRSHLALIPGMTAQVEIITGEKSVLAYLGRPILRGMQGAFHEN